MTLCLLVDENIPAVEASLSSLHGAGDVLVQRANGRALDRAQLAGVDVLLVRSVTTVDESLLAGTAVRFVGTATSGVDHIDQQYLRQHGIGFAHAPGSNANSVVEYVLAAIAACGDHLERLLAGGSAGIIGYGLIGKAVARQFSALNIPHKICDPWLDQATISHRATLAEVLACDVITAHAELTLEQPWPSYHLLDASALASISPHSLLINASRGAVVDSAALLHLLKRGGAPQVVLDVWEGEPSIDLDLLKLVDLATPHIAGYSLDGKWLATHMLCEAMAAHLDLAWSTPQDPAAAAPAVTIPAGLHGVTLLRQLAQARYDILADDSALRAISSSGDPEQAARDFDLLRRQYPKRRELRGSSMIGTDLNADDLQLLAALGVKLQGQAETL